MVSKVLVLGSGGIKIGEAAEFDYSGSQALKALREEGIKSVLMNPNVATIQTSYEMADALYMLPLTPEFAHKVIEKEEIDGIMLGFGGQTALSLGVNLHDAGILQKYDVKVLGTPMNGIKCALRRDSFRKTMKRYGISVPPSMAARNEEEAIEHASAIGYPVMVRVSFNLGGRGSFVAHGEEELKRHIHRAFAQSEVNEVLVEKYLEGWKEIEFEILRDANANAVAIACLENVEPMGFHTGESTVVAPCQTLTNREYQTLRMEALKVAEAINLIGECNVQLSLNPVTGEYYVIETNPRMSRSSALASKATGYPLAYIAAKLALGHTLDKLINKVTGVTSALFEPALDYVVVKIPRWDLDKFENVNKTIGTEMKSIGEVMAVGRNLHEALQKAVRMTGMGDLIGEYHIIDEPLENVLSRIKRREPYILMHVAKALRLGVDIDTLYKLTGIDRFFLYIVEDLVRMADAMGEGNAVCDKVKRHGFSDEQIDLFGGTCTKKMPVVKQIDTVAGEFPARTNYLYITHDGFKNDINSMDTKRILILGAGVFRVGASVEFDWAVVNFANAAKKRGYEVIVLNHNPETVSTDWDMSDKLYFEEISLESVLSIHRYENKAKTVTFAGGQLANSLAYPLEKKGVNLVGTCGKTVNVAENRAKFSAFLESLGIRQPPWIEATTFKKVKKFAEELGYPLIIRPSYVLSGTAMKVVYTEEELKEYLNKAVKVSPRYPVVVSQFLEAREAEIDAVSDGRRVVGVTLEHVEPAGVHSGDATMVTPERHLTSKATRKMREITLKIAQNLKIRGPFNIQFLINREVSVLELNLRTSRSMPFSSKARGVNLMELAAQSVLDGKMCMGEEDLYLEIPANAFAVKSPQFSWAQLQDTYPFLGPEMRSTGEVASLGYSFEDALLKSWLSAKPNKLPRRKILVYGNHDRQLLEQSAITLKNGDYEVLSLQKAPCTDNTVSQKEVLQLIKNKKIDMVVTSGYDKDFDYEIRRAAADMNIPLILNASLALEISRAFIYLHKNFPDIREVSGYWKDSLYTKL